MKINIGALFVVLVLMVARLTFAQEIPKGDAVSEPSLCESEGETPRVSAVNVVWEGAKFLAYYDTNGVATNFSFSLGKACYEFPVVGTKAVAFTNLDLWKHFADYMSGAFHPLGDGLYVEFGTCKVVGVTGLREFKGTCESLTLSRRTRFGSAFFSDFVAKSWVGSVPAVGSTILLGRCKAPNEFFFQVVSREGEFLIESTVEEKVAEIAAKQKKEKGKVAKAQ